MFPIGGNSPAKAALPDIANSLRFSSLYTQYGTWTPSTAPTNKSKWTKSIWFKRSELGRIQLLFGATLNASVNYSVQLEAADNLAIYFSNTQGVSFTRVFRDVSAWHHLVIAWDSANATPAMRLRVYVDNVELITTSSDSRAAITTSHDVWNTQSQLHYLGNNSYNYRVDGNVANYCCIDGQVLTPSSFAYTDYNKQWRSLSKGNLKALADAGGTNSALSTFDNGTSVTTLGYDSSSHANNWTLSNMYRDGGVDDSWSFDTPTRNFATMNPLDKTSGITLAGSGLKTTISSPYNAVVRATMAFSTGKWYWEYVQGVGSGNYSLVGVADASKSVTNVWRNTPNGWYYSGYNGYRYSNSTYISYGASFTNPDVIGIALNMDAGEIEFFKNGVSQGVAYSSLTGKTLAPAFHDPAADVFGTFNFGQRPVAGGAFDANSGGYFRYAPPSGFKAACTSNIVIGAAASNPKGHFDVITWTGANGALGRTFSGLGFKPDFVWGKARSAAASHVLFDSVRGVGKTLRTDTTGAEVTNEPTGYVSAFNADGFTTSPGSSDNWYWNSSGTVFEALLWKAGSSVVTNNTGSIASQVCANTDAGFSIVTYTGTGANATVGHGLSDAPKMVIVKDRDSVRNWFVLHNDGTTVRQLEGLNTTNTATTPPAAFNNTAPTSAVFSLASAAGANGGSIKHVAYCFTEVPGYSKIGSYVGNGLADGPFVQCGFKPRFLMVKSIDAAGVWEMTDTARNPGNPSRLSLRANSSAAEVDMSVTPELLSNGFRPVGANGNLNDSGVTYVFYAVADQTFKFAGAR